MPAIRWSDGEETEAPTWGQLLKTIIAIQWDPHTTSSMKRELARRAALWCGAQVDPEAKAKEFFLSLGDTDAVEIIDEEEVA